ncbi:MAG: DeoR/GlpR family DNA-binding transcription regulator [Bacteroidota bacterium]|uniref:Transcriptional regulator, DeoR family n=1 Tax=Algoriphagus faecimaris TaxID=686796 RepID=A0A1G6T9Y4_9BACT|nr:DeoR/GlpR family DNA-binding transcription regulator [Algoriphagus faecimaris]SDD25942.1 transcriptional regulator, DeoR family [Algoriphagus faecimaris]
MLKEERQKYILDQVHLHHRVLLNDLADFLDVSIDTVRRDVKELAKEKKLKKVHGGATSFGFMNFTKDDGNIYLQSKKIQIAEKTVSLLSEGQVVLMSGGTTNMEVAKMIPRKLPLTVFTPSLHVAMQLLELPEVEVIFLGGKLLHEAKFAVGGTVVNALNQLRVDLCILGTGYLDAEAGLTEFDWEVIQVKRAMIRAAKKTIILSVSDKLHSVQKFQTCDLTAVHTLVTELDPSDPMLDAFRPFDLHLI